jgi:surfactin synthase thioesterase subunit
MKGAGVSVFHKLSQAVSDQVQIIGVRFPGRENRLAEDPFTDVNQMVSDVVTKVFTTRDKSVPFALLGNII